MPNFRVVLDEEGSTCYSGSTVRGHLLFDLTKPKKFQRIFVELIGTAFTKWEENSKCFAEYKETETLVHMADTLWTNQDSADGKLAPGAHRWAFRFTLPQDATSTFQGSKGQVYYYLQGRAKTGGLTGFIGDRSVKLAIRVEQVHRYGGPLQLPRTEEVQKSVCCWPCRSGSVVMTVTLPKTAYVSGEQFTMNVSVQNESNRRVRIKAFLKKATFFTAQGHSTSDQWTLLSLVSNRIRAHTTRDWNPSDEIPSGSIVDCRLIKHRYVFVICAMILGAGKLSVKIPIKVGYVRPLAHYEEAEERVPLTSRPVIHPSHNESGAPLTMSTQFDASNPFPHQPAVIPLVPHPGSRNPLPAQPGVVPGQPGVVPSAPYPAASDPLSYQPGVVPSAPYPAASDPLSYQPGVVPSAPYPAASDPLSYQPGVVPSAPYPTASNPLSYLSGVVPSEPPLMASIYDPPPPYSSQPDLTDPHLQ